MQMYYTVVAQHGSEKIKLEDIMRFPWETAALTSLENKKPRSQEELKSFWDQVDKNKE